MNLKTISLDKLNPAPYNPRFISAEEFKGLTKSLETFGQQENLIVNKDMTLISGHQRYEAMKKLGWTEATCNVVDLDKHQEKKLNVIMNSTAISGKYDDLKLSEILEELKLDDDYESLRLNVLEPLDLSPTEVEEDEAPEVSSEPPVSKLGEVYRLGRHRLMCGDSVSLDDAALLMNGAKAKMVFTDPPWNVNYGAVKAGNKQGYKPRTIENDNMGEDFTPWMNAVFSTLNAISESGCPTYVVMSAQEWGGLMQSLKDNGYHWSSTIIWAKDRLVLSRKDYHTQYEPIWYGWKDDAPRICPVQDRKQSDLWQIDRPSKSDEHPTMKPIELVAKAVQNSSSKDDAVLDLFGGSGSTLIACEQLGRTCYMMELDPKYVDVIRKRYWKFINDGNEEGWEEGTPTV